MNNDWASHFVDPILGSFPLWVMGRHRVTPLFPSKRTFTARFARPLSANKQTSAGAAGANPGHQEPGVRGEESPFRVGGLQGLRPSIGVRDDDPSLCKSLGG